MDLPDMRESCGGDRDKVLLCDPSFPVLHKHVQCALVVLHLAEREFVNDRVVVRTNENARRYPRLLSARSSERLIKDDRVRSTLYLENKPPSTGSKSQMDSRCVGATLALNCTYRLTPRMGSLP
jgi:hypothetical protein